MKTYEHIFKIGLPIALEDEDLLQVKVETISNSVEYDENKENAKERSNLILKRIGFEFKKGLIRKYRTITLSKIKYTETHIKIWTTRKS